MYYCIAQKESKLKIYFNFISGVENTNKNNNIIIYLYIYIFSEKCQVSTAICYWIIWIITKNQNRYCQIPVLYENFNLLNFFS